MAFSAVLPFGSCQWLVVKTVVGEAPLSELAVLGNNVIMSWPVLSDEQMSNG